MLFMMVDSWLVDDEFRSSARVGVVVSMWLIRVRNDEFFMQKIFELRVHTVAAS